MPAAADLRTNAPVRAESRALRPPGTKRRGALRASGPLPTPGKVQTEEAKPLGWERTRTLRGIRVHTEHIGPDLRAL